MKVQHSENIKFKSALQRIVSLFVTLSDTGSECYLYAYQVHFQQNRQYVHIRDYFFSVYLSKTGTALIRPMMSISGWFLDKLMPSDKPLLILRTTVTINVSITPLILNLFFSQGLKD